MNEIKFKQKYRIPPSRAQWWDYGNVALYFITICTKNHKCFFGEIINGKMVVNKLGEFAKNEWEKTANLRQDMNITLGEFIIMPNHFHAIISIGKNEFNTSNETINMGNLIFSSPRKNLSSLVRGYKSAITSFARNHDIVNFCWQKLFHDHIIRNEEAFLKISEYVMTNPQRWEQDKFYQEKM